MSDDADQPFRALADSIPLLCWMANPDGHIFWYNQGWYDYTGTTLAEMEGWGWKSVHDPNLVEQVIVDWTRSLQSGKAFEMEFPLRRADGEFRWHMTRAVPSHDRSGKIVRWYGSNTDVEGARRARTIAEEEREKMYAVFMSAPAFIATLAGPEHVFEFTNPQYSILVGKDRKLLGRTAREAFPEVAGQGFFELVDEVYRTGVPFIGDAMPLTIDRGGEGVLDEIFINFLFQPRMDRDGKVEGITVFGFDVTEQVRGRRMAEEASAQKDAFLAMLAHELRNPLAPMMNATALLKMDVDAAAKARARDVVDRQVRHLARLVDDLLDVSRVARGKIELRPVSLDLAALVSEVVSDRAALLAEAGLVVDTRLPSRTVVVRADRTRLTQTISNLLGNAIKFTPKGGSLELTLTVQDEKTASLTIRDTGIGIARDLLGRIFEPFTQADTTLDRSRGGLGLGLAVAKGIVELHAGTLTARSEGLGKGSTFEIRLPLFDGRADAGGIALMDVRLPGGRRVVVVEDNPDQADTLRELLLASGHEVHVVNDGSHAVETIRRVLPDVVLCDIGLPGKDGFSIAAEVRADAVLKHIRMVALSGYGTKEDRERAARAGFDLHLTKPLDHAALEMILDPTGHRAVGATRAES